MTYQTTSQIGKSSMTQLKHDSLRSGSNGKGFLKLQMERIESANHRARNLSSMDISQTEATTVKDELFKSKFKMPIDHRQGSHSTV